MELLRRPVLSHHPAKREPLPADYRRHHTMTKIPDTNGADYTRSSPRQSARALLRACGKNGYRAEPDSQVLTSAELGELNAEQLDGLTCAFCGGREGAMVPISRGPELFVHAEECPSTLNQSEPAPNLEGPLGIALDCLAEQCSIEQLAAARAIAEELEDEEASAQLGYLIDDVPRVSRRPHRPEGGSDAAWTPDAVRELEELMRAGNELAELLERQLEMPAETNKALDRWERATFAVGRLV
jgi:hypothetical protein